MKDIVKTAQLFSAIDDASAEAIASASHLTRLDRGQIIFSENEPAAAFYIVNRGKVKLFKLSGEGKEQILMIARPGDTFAEAALFAGGRYPASAQALEDSEVLTVHRDQFVALLSKDPNLALNLIARLSQLLRKLTLLVEGLSLSDVTARLARRLVQQIKDQDQAAPEVTLSEKKVVVAAELGTIPETLSRSLAKLTKEGVIEVEGSQIKVLDPNKLREIAQA